MLKVIGLKKKAGGLMGFIWQAAVNSIGHDYRHDVTAVLPVGVRFATDCRVRYEITATRAVLRGEKYIKSNSFFRKSVKKDENMKRQIYITPMTVIN
jgi:hypothetical protein